MNGKNLFGKMIDGIAIMIIMHPASKLVSNKQRIRLIVNLDILKPKNGNWRAQVQQLEDHGWAVIPFSPMYDQPSAEGFQVGFVGNPEVIARYGNARYKKHLARNYRNGIGAFVVVVPATQFITLKTLASEAEALILKIVLGHQSHFSHPWGTQACTGGKCTLDFDNDFTYCDNCWFAAQVACLKLRLPRKMIEQGISELPVASIPEAVRIKLK